MVLVFDSQSEPLLFGFDLQYYSTYNTNLEKYNAIQTGKALLSYGSLPEPHS